MAFWAYLLRCGDGSFYAGHCDNLDTRIGAHMMGRGSDYTARRQPVAFAWAQDFPSRLEALEAERRIKGWSRAKKEALIAGDWERISQLARSYGARPSTGSGRTEEGGMFAPENAVRPELVEGRAEGATP
jgi:putative endonuclease